MTTPVEVQKSYPTISASYPKKFSLEPAILAIFLILVLFSAMVIEEPTKEQVFSWNFRSLDAQAARYQRLADFYASMNVPLSLHSLKAQSARYQGLADLHASAISRSLEARTARYQGLADLYASVTRRSLEAQSARYQVMAEHYR